MYFVGEHSYTPLGNILILHWGILRLSGISSLFSADGISTLLGESIADSFIVASLS